MLSKLVSKLWMITFRVSLIVTILSTIGRNVYPILDKISWISFTVFLSLIVIAFVSCLIEDIKHMDRDF